MQIFSRAPPEIIPDSAIERQEGFGLEPRPQIHDADSHDKYPRIFCTPPRLKILQILSRQQKIYTGDIPPWL
jgi:hypothetical protein